MNILYNFSIVQVFLLLEPQLIQRRIKENHELVFTPLLVGLTFNGIVMEFAAPEVELSDLQIREKLDEINSRYEV
ncbi:hypothetical protein P4H39_30385 [Paenibacillus lautus]|uniref:hypothetical protein n=1 Tax=Paenibacillus lautus TaxID=1401 RepID=UPI002DBCFDE4|nr:hypothetical protein [Paenibacillus lautus]MEC0206925.1 hypothetical protein [Paenibacillus lautus]